MNIQGLPSTGLATAPTSSVSANTSTSGGATLNSNSAEQTFIQLLVTELQSQDPTSPMDPTTMVGQMFSMNQLQQLIDINQTLSNALGGAPSSSSSSSASSATAAPTVLGATLANAATKPTQASVSYAQQLLTGVN
ncbi:MAG: flagellar hook capping FlgD N-terminal domain-containing protein [Terriglobales bacterium]